MNWQFCSGRILFKCPGVYNCRFCSVLRYPHAVMTNEEGGRHCCRLCASTLHAAPTTPSPASDAPRHMCHEALCTPRSNHRHESCLRPWPTQTSLAVCIGAYARFSSRPRPSYAGCIRLLRRDVFCRTQLALLACCGSHGVEIISLSRLVRVPPTSYCVRTPAARAARIVWLR